jgi:para-nitrobenzyl esterase
MAGSDPEVVISTGRIRGCRENGVLVFRGIPFAKPPLSALRFQAPESPSPWDGVLDARAFGPPAPQPAGPGRAPSAGGHIDAGRAEDWLTVNVWTPDITTSGLPVLVWIHGGAYLFGSSAEAVYDGHKFAMSGTVLVTCNYRLGVEGFAEIPGAPANRGLLDLVAVLRWVRENAAGFGGDPASVTVFGESAGAGAVAALLAMEDARGLFRRAIAQSVPGTFFTPELAADITGAIAAQAGLPATYDALAAADPGVLAGASMAVTTRMKQFPRWGPVRLTDTPFSPVVDGTVLTRAPWRALLSGAARDVDLLTGHNRDEYRLFIVASGRLGKITDQEAATVLDAFAPGPAGTAGYRGSYPEAGAGSLFELAFSDWLFRMPTLHLAQAHAASGGRTFLYELRAGAPALDGVLGACHALDVPLVFGPGRPGGPRDPGGPGITDLLLGDHPPAGLLALGDLMRGEWVRFASRGDPGWPAYGTRERITRIYDVPPDVGPYPEERSMRLWQRHQFGTLDLAAGPQADAAQADARR